MLRTSAGGLQLQINQHIITFEKLEIAERSFKWDMS